MSHFRIRSGYIFLFSVIMMGAIAVATLGSLLLIGLGSLQIGATVEQTEQARSLAQTCADRALRSLWENLAYTGNEYLLPAEGECDILPVGGSGNEDRSVCIEGRVGFTVRRYEILLKRVLPSIQVYSWREVEQFALCSYAPDAVEISQAHSTSASSSSPSYAAATTLAYGPAVVLPHASGEVRDLSIIPLSDTNALVTYWVKKTDGSWVAASQPVSVQSRSVSFGAEEIFHGPEESFDSENTHHLAGVKLDASHALLVYGDGSYGCHGVVATVDGTQVAYGTPSSFDYCNRYFDVIALSPSSFIVATGPLAASMVDVYTGTVDVSQRTVSFGNYGQMAAGFNMTVNARPFALAPFGSSHFVFASLNGPAIVYRPRNPLFPEIAHASNWNGASITACNGLAAGSCQNFIRLGGAPLSAINLNNSVAITPAYEEVSCRTEGASVIVGVPDSGSTWESFLLPASDGNTQPLLLRLSAQSFVAAYGGTDNLVHVEGKISASDDAVISMAPPPWVPFAGSALNATTLLFANAGPLSQKGTVAFVAGEVVQAIDPRCGNGLLEGDEQCETDIPCQDASRICDRGVGCVCVAPLPPEICSSAASSHSSLASSAATTSSFSTSSFTSVSTTTSSSSAASVSSADTASLCSQYCSVANCSTCAAGDQQCVINTEYPITGFECLNVDAYYAGLGWLACPCGASSSVTTSSFSTSSATTTSSFSTSSSTTTSSVTTSSFSTSSATTTSSFSTSSSTTSSYSTSSFSYYF